MKQKNKNEKQIVETQETFIQNTQSDLEKKECKDIGKVKRNKTGTKFYEFKGETKSIVEWLSDPRCLISSGGFYKRLKLGWNPFDALFKKPQENSLSKYDRQTISSWRAMIQRCNNSKSTGYKSYGGRGIKVCKYWLDFENFYLDLGKRPDKYTLDRIDNNLNYSCGHCEECLKNKWKMNCRWSNRKIQGRNRSDCKYITYKGKTQCVADWAEEYNLNVGTLRSRLRNGWEFEKCLSSENFREISYKYNTEKFILNNKEYTLKELGKEYNLSYHCLKQRLKRMSVEEAIIKPQQTQKKRSQRLNILVVGGDSFIAKSIRNSILNKSHNITFLTKKELDLTKIEDLKLYFNNKYYDFVINCAISGGRLLEKDDFKVFYENVLGEQNLMFFQNHFGKIILFGSGGQHNRNQDIINVKEGEFRELPINPYSLSKYINAKLIQNNKKVIFLRIFNVFGNGEASNRFISVAIKNYINKKPIKIWSDKLFDFFFINDLLIIIDFVLKNKFNKFFELNCVYLEKLKFSDICDIINSLNNYRVEVIYEDGINHHYVGDGSKLAALNLPFSGLKKGIELTYKELLNEQS